MSKKIQITVKKQHKYSMSLTDEEKTMMDYVPLSLITIIDYYDYSYHCPIIHIKNCKAKRWKHTDR